MQSPTNGRWNLTFTVGAGLPSKNPVVTIWRAPFTTWSCLNTWRDSESKSNMLGSLSLRAEAATARCGPKARSATALRTGSYQLRTPTGRTAACFKSSQCSDTSNNFHVAVLKFIWFHLRATGTQAWANRRHQHMTQRWQDSAFRKNSASIRSAAIIDLNKKSAQNELFWWMARTGSWTAIRWIRIENSWTNHWCAPVRWAISS